MPIRFHDAAGGLVIEVRGCFDPDEADRLHALLLEVEPATSITVDFHEVRLFHDTAVARLAREIAARRQVSLLGLSEHHHRLLRYIGSSTAALPAESTAHA